MSVFQTAPGDTLEVPFDNVPEGYVTLVWSLSDTRDNVVLPEGDDGVTTTSTGIVLIEFDVPADLEGGEYVLTLEVDGVTASEIIVVDVPDPDLPEWGPKVSRVASLLRTRTGQTETRNELAVREHKTFTAYSRPTYEEVAELIRSAVDDVTNELGGREPCTTALQRSAGTCAVYRTCQLIETSFYTEQTSTDRTAFASFEKLWTSSVSRLATSVAAQCPLVTPPGQVGGGPLAPVARLPRRKLFGPDDGMVF